MKFNVELDHRPEIDQNRSIHKKVRLVKRKLFFNSLLFIFTSLDFSQMKNAFFSNIDKHLQKVFVSFRFCMSVFFLRFSLRRKKKKENLCFVLERTSKRSRILNFFRGRARPSERAETNNDRELDHLSFIDKTTMK